MERRCSSEEELAAGILDSAYDPYNYAAKHKDNPDEDDFYANDCMQRLIDECKEVEKTSQELIHLVDSLRRLMAWLAVYGFIVTVLLAVYFRK